MLKAKGTLNGRPTLILGLTRENIRRLQADSPIHFTRESVEIEHDVIILYGADEGTLIDALGVGRHESAERAMRALESEKWGTERDIHVTHDANDEPPPRYLIWSKERTAWWRPGGAGYTQVLDQAGRYPREIAKTIVTEANRFLPEGQRPTEVLVLAPEYTGLP